MSSSHPDVDLQAVHDALIAVAKQAGERILSARPHASSQSHKLNSIDVVTETDKAVEKLVYERLTAQFPSYKFVGEETFDPATDSLSADPTFIVDPIDGTTNFIHSFPYVSISLGFTIGLIPAVGVVYNPFTQTLYSGIKGRGSYVTSPLHDRVKLPLVPHDDAESENQTLNTTIITADWGDVRGGNDLDVRVDTFRSLVADLKDGGAMIQGIRMLGSAALNFCGVAAGQLHMYWTGGAWAWDVAAGWLILTEAGGRVVGANPNVWEPRLDSRKFLIVRPGKGQERLIKEFWSHVKGRLDVGDEVPESK